MLEAFEMNVSSKMFEIIREQDPLKQGLKHYCIESFRTADPEIREQDPLKQGLKLLIFPAGATQLTIFVSKIH